MVVGESESSGVQQPTRRGLRRLTRHPAVLFGAVGLPLMLAVGWLWLKNGWPCSPTGDGMAWLCSGLSMVFYGSTLGFAFWYVAGLAWGWPAGLVGPAAGAAAGAAAGVVLMGLAKLMGLPEMNVLGGVGGVGVASGMVAAVGIFAYPLGLLARWALGRHPLPPLGCGGLMLVLGIAATVAATPSVYSAAPMAALFAPAMLVAGGGTLAVSAWLGALPGSPSTDAASRRG